MNRRMLGYGVGAVATTLILAATSCAPKNNAEKPFAPAIEKTRTNAITVSKIEYSTKFQEQLRTAISQIEEKTPDNQKTKQAIIRRLDAQDPNEVKREMGEALKVSLKSLTNDPLFKQHPDISLNGIIREGTTRDENGKSVIDQFMVVELSLPGNNGKPVRVASLYFNGEDLGAELDAKKSYGTNIHPEQPATKFGAALNDIKRYCDGINTAVKAGKPDQGRRIVSLDSILCLG